jgi:hypothetical protein
MITAGLTWVLAVAGLTNGCGPFDRVTDGSLVAQLGPGGRQDVRVDRVGADLGVQNLSESRASISAIVTAYSTRASRSSRPARRRRRRLAA